MSLESLVSGIRTFMRHSAFAYALALGACAGADSTAAQESADGGQDASTCVDNDHDGYFSNCGEEIDCDDANAQIHPGAQEYCDFLDNNCNNETDEEALYPFYLDNDNDGFGDPGTMQKGCIKIQSDPKGKDFKYVTNNDDCDDGNSAINPNAFELCDGIDNNCLDGADEGYELGNDCYVGVGECQRVGQYQCAENGLAAICDAVPGLPSLELCDGLDNDCDEEIDEEGGNIYYADGDGDGQGDAARPMIACGAAPEGYVANPSDCDDGNGAAYQNLPAYTDEDGDGFGAGVLEVLCAGAELPLGYAANDADCEDGFYEIHPGALEICDGIDNDCDPLSADGFGEGAPLNSLQAGVCLGSQQVCSEGEWDDYYAGVVGYGIEGCDGMDNDCGGGVDEGLAAPSRDCTAGVGECTRGGLEYRVCLGAAGWSAGYGGCTAIASEPSEEICDGLDNDCDGEEDEGNVCNRTRILFRSSSGPNFDIYSVDPANPADIINLTNHPAYDQNARWSPDRSKIVFVSDRDHPSGEIYTMNADGGEVRRLTSNTYLDARPAWSPEGTQIAFHSNRADIADQIYIMNADGTGQERATNESYHCHHPDWSPNGVDIVFYKDDTFGLRVFNIRDRVVTIVSESGLLPEYSPDGRRIVFTESNQELYIINNDGTGRTYLGVHGYEPSWSPDGRSIAYSSGDGIRILNIETREDIIIVGGGLEPNW